MNKCDVSGVGAKIHYWNSQLMPVPCVMDTNYSSVLPVHLVILVICYTWYQFNLLCSRFNRPHYGCCLSTCLSYTGF